MKKTLKNGVIITPYGIVKNGSVVFDGEKIISVGFAENEGEVIDVGGEYIMPGFIDIHIHGGGGHDFMEPSPHSAVEAARAHLLHGTTSLLATSCASENEELFDMFDSIRRAKEIKEDFAEICGIHLEGPYLNVKMKGAMREQLLTDPLPEYYEPVLQRGGDLIKRWTVAPEKNGAFDFARLLASRGIVVSAGHTTANPAIMAKAGQNGFSLATHLYNAMTSMHKEGVFRLAGAAEGALVDDAYDVELVADGVHQPKEILHISWKLKGSGKMALITDAMAAAGLELPSGSYAKLASREVVVEDNVAKLADRSAIAGSIATTDRLLRVAVDAGIPLFDAVTMLTATPARIMSFGKKGKLEAGCDSDILVLTKELKIDKVFKGGREIK